MPKEYIEREIVLSLLNRNSITKYITFADDVSIYDAVKSLPTADVVEVKHGEWRDKDWSGIAVKGYMACSQCNVMIPRCEGTQYCLNYLYFCPKCGAKMDRKDK